MKNSDNKLEALQNSYRELQLICDVWVAANEAKDQRIAELEHEIQLANQRIGRLSRLVGRKPINRATAKQAGQ